MSKIIKCKVCGEEISSNAKACPKCGEKNKKPIFKKVWFWILVAIILVACISNCSKGSQNINNNSTSTTQTAETTTGSTETKMYSVGEVLNDDKFETTVLSIEEKSKVGSQYLSSTASDGGTYVCITYQYKNISDKPISAFSCPEIYLKDESGTRYESDISASAYYATEKKINAKVVSDLNPGISVTDAKVFEISKQMYDDGKLFLLVDSNKDFNVSLK